MLHLPIGRPCEHYEARVVGRDGEVVVAGTRAWETVDGYCCEPA